jgi:glycosyltransferase involved in cell wall biosynthesis
VSSKSIDYEIIHLSTGHLGGAGLAARRLNQALNYSGVKSTFAALARKDFIPLEHEISIPRNLFSKYLSGVLAYLQSKLSTKIFFSLISLNSLNRNILLKNTTSQNTILHIHNWFNLVNIRSILKLQRQGFHIVITLHDQRIMTGGCHYPIECRNFEQSCSNCPLLPVGLKKIPSLILKLAGILFVKFSPKITFIAPSNWILREAGKSRLLRNSSVVFIPNSLGTLENDLSSTYLLHQKASGSERTKIGIASMDSKSYVKGGDVTAQISELLKTRNLGFEFIYMNDFEQNSFGKTKFWQSIDYLLVVSRAENSPNVIHEAKQLGIPIIASKIGGITELLDSEYDVGIDSENLNSSSVLGILSGLSNRQLSRDMQQQMQVKFYDYVDQSIASHIELYKRILNEG